MMLTLKRTVSLLVLVVFALGCFMINAGGGIVHPSAAATPGPAEIFAAHCAECHGRDGRARTAKGKRAGATDLTSDWNRDPARGVRIITNGKGQMPSFRKTLTAAEIRAVFSYVSRF